MLLSIRRTVMGVDNGGGSLYSSRLDFPGPCLWSPVQWQVGESLRVLILCSRASC